MPFKIPAYPDELTNAAWQKKKGILAKIAGETGIGDMLKELVKEYGHIDWEKFKLATAAKGQGAKRTKQDVKDAYDDAIVECKKVFPLQVSARNVEKKADALAIDWKKNKAIPASSVKAAVELSGVAKAFSYAIAPGTIGDELDKERKECDASIDKIADEYSKMNDKFRTYVNGFEAACKGKTLKEYGALWKENIRGVGTLLPVIAKQREEFVKEWTIWKNFSNVLKEPATEEEMQKQLQMLIKVAASLKPKAARLR